MVTGSIHQTIEFQASSSDVYEMLMDEKLHAIITGSDVTLNREVKGTFNVFDGYCSGYNMVLSPGEEIVQAWNFKEENWPANHYSICTFKLKDIAGGCSLDFTQTGVPEQHIESLSEGWEQYYWQPMKSYIEDK